MMIRLDSAKKKTLNSFGKFNHIHILLTFQALYFLKINIYILMITRYLFLHFLNRHPYVVLFHIGFRAAAILVYLFCGWFSDGFVTSFVFTVILLSLDFWTVKNITGLQLHIQLFSALHYNQIQLQEGSW